MKAQKKNENFWLRNPYPEICTSKIINVVLLKIIGKPHLKNGGEKVQLRGKMLAKDVNLLFLLHYRSNISLQLKQKFAKEDAN